MTIEIKNAFRAAFRASLPIMAGYLALGMGFGILLVSRGYPFWWAPLMSITMYAGAMQYAAVELMASDVSLLMGALMTVMINIRHLFYGITMLQKYNQTGKFKPYLIFSLTDETYSLVCHATLSDAISAPHYYFFLSIFNHCYWIAGGMIGALLGNILPFSTKGIDFVMTALFVVIFVEQWEKAKSHLPALVGLFGSALCLILFPSRIFLIPAMVLLILLLLVFRKRLEGSATDATD